MGASISQIKAGCHEAFELGSEGSCTINIGFHVDLFLAQATYLTSTKTTIVLHRWVYGPPGRDEITCHFVHSKNSGWASGRILVTYLAVKF
ncbi:hypothetical protein QZH56_30520 [Streptomyces olivoreticuli]|uniref:hypothetical protein n=1 Tax=Streptomyces olivoreticuli TaxID=68246 RepID=UPI002657DBAB|nr:hypothetical protein [Streptomyces olivoreticuli]WKK23039.1 hypothetical protein QZH56_30520 [Streptomyces olivoreticuli]